jgi:hypothetical protein
MSTRRRVVSTTPTPTVAGLCRENPCRLIPGVLRWRHLLHAVVAYPFLPGAYNGVHVLKFDAVVNSTRGAKEPHQDSEIRR